MEINGHKIEPYADLQDANLRGADLRNAHLRNADLRNAHLRGADLWDADLRGADLYGADLRGANLLGANLRGANLRGANLDGANLLGANLRGADLRGADLYGADLYGADLRGANLRGANLDGAFGIAETVITPEGELIVWKKCVEGVVKLRIPAEAKRSNATTRKCRAEFAVVLELPPGVEVAHSEHDYAFTYRTGETVRPKDWCEDRWIECGGGIHFFLTREEAEAW